MGSSPEAEGGFVLLRRLAPEPGVFWAWAFLAILASGAFTVVVPSPWASPIGYVLATLYPGLLLAGGLGYAGRRVPGALLPAVLGVGTARGVACALELPAVAHGIAGVAEPALGVAAALAVARAPTVGPATFAQQALVPALLAMAALEAATAWAMLDGSPLPQGLVVTWIAGASLLLGTQIAAAAAVTRQRLEATRTLLRRQLREETERYRAVSELSSDYSFAFRVARDGGIQREWATDAVQRVTGYTPEELDRLGWFELVPPAERERVVREAAEVLAGREDALETTILHQSGEERIVRVRLAQGASSRGRLIVGAARDVTEQRRAERERHRLDVHMREMQRLESLGRLAGGIAHDFHNALTVILGNTRLAMEELEKGTLERGRLRRVVSASEFAAGLTEQILTYAGEAAVELEPLDLSRVVSEIQELLLASVGGKVTLDFHLPSGLPLFEGDVTQIRQVLVNLVTNASEAIGEQGGSVSLRTGTRGLDEREVAESYGAAGALPGHYVMLEVADSGPGLEPGERARIFEPFFTTKPTGRGFGLASVLGIVRAHGGLVDVESARGRGTTFRVFLPRSRRTARPAVPAPAGARGRGRILVVDDDDAVLEVAASFLERAGFDVTTASAAGAALELLRDPEIPCDAVVLDLVMPDLSAEEAALRLRELRPGLPVLLTSGYDREQATRRFGSEGVTDFVRKPFGPEELVEGVQRVLSRSEQGRVPVGASLRP